MKTTIYHVALEAGVSISTVSKVINNTGRISEPTRKKVKKVMKDLNFQPSVVASALTGKQTKTIGLLISDISNPFYAEIARHIENRSRELGFHVMMCSTDDETEKEEVYLSLLTRQRVDGLIVASAFRNSDLLLELLTNQKCPIAIIASEIPNLSINTIKVDDYKGGYLATSHLVKLGHRKIAMISENIRSARLRISAFKDVMEDANLPIIDDFIVRTEATNEKGYEAAIKLLTRKDKPTAIFASNDLLATGVIKAARSLRISIPKELSVIGFDNTILSTTVSPTLTTIAQPMKEMGTEIVDLLIDEMEAPSILKQRLLLEPKIIVRESTAPLLKK